MPEETHSIYGASIATRWRTCSGSVDLIRKGKESGEIPRNATSAFAEEGTIAHDWSNKILIGEATFADIPDSDMRRYVKDYVKICEAIRNEEKDKQSFAEYNEFSVPLFYRPEDRGTLDFAVVSTDAIKFTDLKYGQGVKVDAEENDQLIIYGMSIVAMLEHDGWELPNDMPVHLSIYQPRHREFDGIDTWETTVRDLKDYAVDIESDYQRALTDKTLKASYSACKFCDAKGICPERTDTAFSGFPPSLTIVADDFDDSEIVSTVKKLRKEPRSLTKEQRAAIIEHGSLLKKLVDDVIEDETKRLQTGGEIFTHKLIAGNAGNRKWSDEADAEKLLKPKLGIEETFIPRKLISAPQALELLKPKMAEMSTRFKNRLEELIVRPEGKPKLVSIDNDKPALTFEKPEDDFGKVLGDDVSSML
jgi:hypothetical protein